MILADIGNRHIHIYEDGAVLNLDPHDAIENFGERIVHYICVNESLRSEIVENTYWRDISSRIELKGSYEKMGVDRKALCLSMGDGLYIDAGSAITIDKVSGGEYMGGYIVPGLYSMLKAYSGVSALLEIDPHWHIDTQKLHKGTREQISSSIVLALEALVATIRDEDEAIYCTGGDARIVSSWFEGSICDDALVFKGILRALNDSGV